MMGFPRRFERRMSSSGDGTDGVDRAALYVYPGDFERRGLQVGGVGDEWVEGSIPVETQYLIAGSRLVWKEGAAPGSGGTGFENEARLTYAVTNLIQSTSAVIDLFSGQLLERGTYYPNGARETLRTERSEGFSLEPMGFTGKEGDDEVGLVYFGERYLMPHLGRWASPDPLQVHAGGGGEFGNSYHYVSGNLLQARDPNGLDVTIAQHQSGDTVTRRVDIGVLVVAGDRHQDEQGTVTMDELREEAARLESALRHTYQDFEVSEDGKTYKYEFVVDVQVSNEVKEGGKDGIPATVANQSASDTRPPGADYRSPTTALAEAAGRGLENVYVVNPSLGGQYPASGRHEVGDDTPGMTRGPDGVNEQAGNVIFAERDIGEATMAHEMAHNLGLGHVTSSGNVTDNGLQRREAAGLAPSVFQDGRPTPTEAPRLSDLDERRIHLSIQRGAEGMRMPERLQTFGTEAPAQLPNEGEQQ